MKRLYSIIMFLALMVAAMGLTACPSSSDDDDDDECDYWGMGPATLTVDDQRCCPNKNSYINEGRKALHISANYVNEKNVYNVWEIDIHILDRPFVISKLNTEDTYYYKNLEIEEFRRANHIPLYESHWDMIGGSITVESVDNKSVKLRIDSLRFGLNYNSTLFGDYYPENSNTHVINGTAIFHNHIWADDDWKPFY